ncbi:DNA pilot protein [Microviridae sp.]|nr:DNA pilot protein [Microviridae sp.]
MVWPAVIAGGIAAAGAIGSAVVGSSSNKRIARRNRGFQERMYRNQYQYKVQDLKKAGLNPILAAGSMGGGSTPQGSMTQNQPADLSGAVTSAASAMRADKERKLMDAQLEQIRSQSNLNKSQQQKVEAGVNTELAHQDLMKSSARLNNANAAIPEVKASFLNGLDASGTAKNVGQALNKTAQQLSPTKSKSDSRRGKLDAKRNRSRSNASRNTSNRSITPYKSKKSQQRKGR